MKNEAWSHGGWIYNYLCNQCLSPLKLWVRNLFMARCIFDTTLCDKVCQWLATGPWFSPGSPVSSTNKTDRHDIPEIWLKVALNTINLSHKPTIKDVIKCSSGHFPWTLVVLVSSLPLRSKINRYHQRQKIGKPNSLITFGSSKAKRTKHDCKYRLSEMNLNNSGKRRVNLVTHPVINHEWGKDREVFTASGTYPWSFVTQ